MNTQRLELYSPYERIWHWLQTAGVLLLIAMVGAVVLGRRD